MNKLNSYKILFMIGSLEIGGAEQQLFLLIKHLKKRGITCLLFVLNAEGPLLNEFLEMGIKVFSGGLKQGDIKKTPLKLANTFFKLIRVIKSERPNVLHAFLPLVTFVGAVAGRLLKVPLVITSRRGLGNHQDRYPILKPLDQVSCRLSHFVTVNSMAVLMDTKRREKTCFSKLILIYNGIETVNYRSIKNSKNVLRKSIGIDTDDKILIYIANLITYKGHLDLFHAFYKVNKQLSNVKLLLVGQDRGIGEKLWQHADEIGIRKNIIFLGQRNDISELLSISDVFVLPSHEEGFSNVILEAMASSLPVIATAVGGNEEAVIDKVTGWIVPPTDPDKLAEKICDLLMDPSKAIQWGRKGKEVVKEKFDAMRMIDRHLDLYRNQFVKVSD